MKKMLENCWVRLILFFGVGILLMSGFQMILSAIDEKRLKGLMGRYNYYIVKYIVLILLGTTVFIVLSKIIRGKESCIFRVDELKKSRIGLGIIIGGGIPTAILCSIFLFLIILNDITDCRFSEEFTFLGVVSIGLNVLSTAIFEELGFRSFVFGLLKSRYHVKIAAIVTSLLFSLIHIGSNVSVICYINLFLLSFFFIQINMFYNTLWASISAHFMWNFVHSVILSLRMYGAEYYPHLLENKVGGVYFVSGGNLGLENSILVTVCLAVVLICFKFLQKKESGYREN